MGRPGKPAPEPRSARLLVSGSTVKRATASSTKRRRMASGARCAVRFIRRAQCAVSSMSSRRRGISPGGRVGCSPSSRSPTLKSVGRDEGSCDESIRTVPRGTLGSAGPSASCVPRGTTAYSSLSRAAGSYCWASSNSGAPSGTTTTCRYRPSPTLIVAMLEESRRAT
jgi:hypothetical protein